MDTYSPGQAAARLGVSRRRITALAEHEGLGERRGNRLTLSDADLEYMRACMGELPGHHSLSRSELLILAELSRRPRGLVSSRAVARACAISPTTARKTVQALLDRDLVVARVETVALGRARKVTSLHANVRHPEWTELLPTLRGVIPAVPVESPWQGAIPPSLRHAFWNVPAAVLARLTPGDDGPFIAARALTTSDLDLLAFAACALPPSAWQVAARGRGLSAAHVDLAENVASAP